MNLFDRVLGYIGLVGFFGGIIVGVSAVLRGGAVAVGFWAIIVATLSIGVMVLALERGKYSRFYNET